MKKIIVFFACAVMLSSTASACPFCGCGGGNLYMGLLPDYQHQFFGLRYNYSTYHTVLASDTSQFSHNTYNTIELWYGLHIGKKFQVLAFVPYNFNKQADDDATTTKNGFGDISLLGQYQVFHSVKIKTESHSVTEQQLWLGGGFKLPTGVFNVDLNDQETTLADINAQLGTGSVDFLLNGLYSLRLGNFGVNLNANYKINSSHEDVRFGNKLSLNTIAYYHIGFKKTSFNPNIGINYEHTDASSLPETLKDFVPYTQSHVFTGSLGMEFNVKKIGLGLTAQLPVQQNFADHQTTLNFRGMAHITFML